MRKFDVIVIGGGITGAGIARDSAMRGFETLLIEQNSFGGHTTLASTCMIHGGLKYQNDDVSVTKLSCIDGGAILAIAPHLLTRQVLFMPIYANHAHGIETLEIFLEGYDAFQPLKGGKKHTRLTPQETAILEPNINQNGLIGSLTFDEWRVDPLRLTLANLASAKLHGAVLLSQTNIMSIDPSQHIVHLDIDTDVVESIQGKVIINATGPSSELTAKLFNGFVRLRCTKGSHIFVDKKICDYGFLIPAKDSNYVFVMPATEYQLRETGAREGTMIGPTNVMFYGNSFRVEASEDEIGYLLEAVNYVSVERLARKNVIKTISGLRPQLYHYGVSDYRVTHDYAIYDHRKQGINGFFTIAGGKMSIYRKMAEEVVDAVCEYLDSGTECTTHRELLPQFEERSIPEKIVFPTTPVSLVSIPRSRLALRGHNEVSSIAWRKKLYAIARLVGFGVLHYIRKACLAIAYWRKKTGIEFFRERYGLH
ncbi:MAG: FAD-dependent oxidoreductase [Parcubacteria group bacterium]|nr:FAD-dependent oxidoreductase [Parcubacteria group bacterium]